MTTLQNNNLLKTKIDEIENILSEIEKSYQEHNALILTEDDLKCILFAKISDIDEFSGCDHPTSDNGVTGSKVHSELSWYDKNDKLAIKPDISIIQPKFLSIHKSTVGGRLPSKQYSFGGNSIIFELKFCRYKSGITSAYFEKQIKKDFGKIDELFARLEHNGFGNSVFCYFVIFNKTDNKCNDFLDYLNENRNKNRKIIYKTGNINIA